MKLARHRFAQLTPSHSRLLLSTVLLTAAVASSPAALANCACMCIEGAPYNVCTSGFDQTKTTTEDCTATLADQCPSVEPQGTGEDQDQTEFEPDPVNAAARENGLNCMPRQVYRPDLAEHKVYTVCMPDGVESERGPQNQRAAATSRAGRSS